MSVNANTFRGINANMFKDVETSIIIMESECTLSSAVIRTACNYEETGRHDLFLLASELL